MVLDEESDYDFKEGEETHTVTPLLSRTSSFVLSTQEYMKLLTVSRVQPKLANVK